MKEICEKYFSTIEDLRCQCDVEHKLVDVLIIVMCSVLCGLDKPEDIATYGKEKIAFLEKHFNITKSPSESTILRILNMVNGEAVAECVVNIMREKLDLSGEVIAIDGKTICSTAKKNRIQEKLHILTAYMTQTGVTLGQLTVNEKTNEIPVLRDLLDMMDIKGKIITADAMHCQKDTVEKIVELGGDYVIGLKGNQGVLFNEVKSYIDDCIDDKNIVVETAQTIEKNKDRLERRICYKAPDIEWFESKDEWAGLSAAFAVRRIFTTKEGTSDETNYYITSRNNTAEKLLEIVREHWKIESMHWILDAVFSEDECRILSTNGQITLNVFRKSAVAFHKSHVSGLKQKTKPSFKNSMLKSLMSDAHLLKVITSL